MSIAHSCAACGTDDPPPQGLHSCAECSLVIHSYIVCASVWMPVEGTYFCCRRCVVAFNDKAEAGKRLPVRPRPDSEETPRAQREREVQAETDASAEEASSEYSEPPDSEESEGAEEAEAEAGQGAGSALAAHHFR